MRVYTGKDKDKQTKRGNKYKVISVTEFFDLVSKGQKEFIEYWIEGNDKRHYYDCEEIKNKKLEHIVFDDCMFYQLILENNSIKNCSFIDCEFGRCNIHNNNISDIYSDQTLIEEYSDVQFNIFDNVKGNMNHANGFNTFNNHNVFKNMSMDGFIGLFCQDAFTGGALRWGNNFYYNSTISLDAISTLSDEARFIWNGKNYWDTSDSRDIVEEKDGTDVTEWFGTDNFMIDMENMSKSGKINLVANLFTKLCKGTMFIAYENYEATAMSTIDFHTEPNPLPIKIVSNDGNVIDISKMPDINIKVPYKPNYRTMSSLSHQTYDGGDLEHLFEGLNDITKPENHICKQLVFKSNND